jgi:regulator of replication initiation timing
VPVAKYTEDKRPKPDMSQSKAVRDFGDLRAKQAAFLAAKAKAAPQGPTSPVSSSGGRPGSSNLTRQSSSSPESPVQRQADLTATPSTLQAAQEVPNGKTARARLFKSGQSSPVAPASPQHAGTTPDKQQPSQQQSSSQQLSEQLPEKLLHQQQQQQSHSTPQLQQHPQAQSAAAQPQESSEIRPAQAQQQSESMQQLLRPSGPSTLRNSFLEQLTQGAPTSSGWPAEVKQYFKNLLDHSVELSLEKHGLNDKLGRAEAQAQEVQEHLEYQAEQMMDLQSQVSIHAHDVCPVCPCLPVNASLDMLLTRHLIKRS